MLRVLSILKKAHVAETSSFVASVFCYDQAIKHDIRLKIHSNEHIQYRVSLVDKIFYFSVNRKMLHIASSTTIFLKAITLTEHKNVT